MGTGWSTTPTVGSYDGRALVHEAGHAHGLKHGLSTGYTFLTMPNTYNFMYFTVMSYCDQFSATPNSCTPTANTINPQGGSAYFSGFSAYDLGTLELLYGRRTCTTGCTVAYTWNWSTGATSVNGAQVMTPGAGTAFIAVTISNPRGVTSTVDLTGAPAACTPCVMTPGGAMTVSTSLAADPGAGAQPVIFMGYTTHTDAMLKNFVGIGGDVVTQNARNNDITSTAGTVVYTGAFANYTITGAASVCQIVDNRDGSPDGTDILRGITTLTFSGGNKSLNSSCVAS